MLFFQPLKKQKQLPPKFPLYGDRGLIIYYLLHDGFRNFSPLILLVAQLWFKAGFPDGILYGFISKPVRRSGCTYYVFFYHDRAKIIGATMQTDLCGLLANCQPAGLYVFYIGQHDAARSEEHTSELQSPCNLVCRLLLEQ